MVVREDGAGADQEGQGSRDVATKKGGRTGVCAEKMVRAVSIGEKAAFAMVVKGRKRVKAWKRFLTALPGVLTHARGRGVSGNVPTRLPKTFPRGQSRPVRVHAEERGRRTCACSTSDWRTVINATVLI